MEGAANYGGKVLHAGGLTETTEDAARLTATTDYAALHPMKQISQAFDFSIAKSPPSAARVRSLKR